MNHKCDQILCSLQSHSGCVTCLAVDAKNAVLVSADCDGQ